MASKVNIVGIVAWVLVVVLAIGAGTLGFLFQKQTVRATGWQGALSQVATTAGIQDLAAGAALTDMLQRVQTTIQGTQQELATTKESLAASQSEASGAKAEVATLQQGAQEQTAKMEGLTKDLAAKDEALVAAKAEAEKAAQETKAAQEAAAKQKAELEGTIEGLKAQMAEETARLQAELEAARQPPPVEVAAPATEGEGAAVASETGMPAEAAAEEAAAEEPAAEEEAGRVIGQSPMISFIRYLPEDQSLYLRLLDGQSLTYQDVPPGVYDQFVAYPEKLDMNFRFKIQGVYKSLPPDSVVIRKYWKWQRRNKTAAGDVRVVDPPAPSPAAEEIAPPETAPAALAPEAAAPAAEAPAAAVEAEAVPAAAPAPAGN